jgi:hypothetical protein
MSFKLAMQRLVIGGAALALVVSPPAIDDAAAQERGNLLRAYGNGPADRSLPQQHNTDYIMRLKQVQELLIAVRAEPRDAGYIETGLAGSGITLDDLLTAEVLYRDGESFALNFPLLTAEDAEHLLEVSMRFARSLADRYTAQRAAIEEILSAYPFEQIDVPTLAYILVGCFSLDWEGLALTRELGYRTVRPEPPRMVRWAIVEGAWRPKGIYWGSHNNYLDNGMVLTSFGDFHTLPRAALPDVAYLIQRGIRTVEVPEPLRPTMRGVARRASISVEKQLAAIMMTLRDGGPATAEEIAQALERKPAEVADYLVFLDSLDYVSEDAGSYAIAVPVLSEEDHEMVQELRQLSRDIMTAWLAENYEQYKEALMAVTPIGHARPFAFSFWNTWHWLFGATNLILTQDGLLTDPYAEHRRFLGSVPVVWSASLMADIPHEHIYQ